MDRGLPISNFDERRGFFATHAIPRTKAGKLIAVAAVIGTIFMLFMFWSGSSRTDTPHRVIHGAVLAPMPVQSSQDIYSIGVIADKDKKSKSEDGKRWQSIFKTGRILHTPNQFEVMWEDETLLEGEMNEAGRGMELSELVNYNGMLLTCDDRSGIVYEIVNKKLVVARFILPNGDGHTDKGFKCEWMTVKDGLLYVGSTGKEWTQNGKVINHDPMWVKVIDARGHVTHLEWEHVYNKLRQVTGTTEPGYLLHEAVAWHQQRRQWFVLPRRVSTLEYDDVEDERRGSNTVLICSEDFSSVEVKHIGEMIPSHGFSSVKFLPGRPDTFIVVKSEEDGANIASYLAIYQIDGTVLMPETKFADVKYEGVEILSN
eukprot:TRINITY_DN2674_c0_g1_i1.p1 TRINITY_DN2674_c0_g1~~TRINITY_DN2674_c0_g1_i1.p1  ORF type:complete len:396 (+),score=80.19 TRINITY_DN2674_c0_g1_i1:73-1188(+)